MSELGSGSGSSYPASLDTDNTLEVDSPSASKTLVRAAVPNDANAAIVAIETELGTDPAGSLTDVKTFLQIDHNTDGTERISKRYVADTGTANTYAIAPTPAITAYAAGQKFSVLIGNASTGASTLNVNSLGVKTIVKTNGVAITTGDLLANHVYTFTYNGTNFEVGTPSSIAYENEANTFTQRITGQSDLLLGPNGRALFGESASGDVSIRAATSGAVLIRLVDDGGNVKFDFNLATGKMSAGIVALDRVGVSGTLTFTAVAITTDGSPQTVTHGLGTDNVQVILSAVGTGTGGLHQGVVARRPDGLATTLMGSAAGLPSIPSAPSSGDVVINVRNTDTLGTNTVTVRYTILRES